MPRVWTNRYTVPFLVFFFQKNEVHKPFDLAMVRRVLAVADFFFFEHILQLQMDETPRQRRQSSRQATF